MENKKYLVGVFSLALILLILSGCGRSSGSNQGGLAPNPIPTPFPTPTPTYIPIPTVTPTATPIPPTPTPPPPWSCSQPLILQGGLLNPTNPVIAGQPVVMHLQAFMCSGVKYQVQGRGPTPFFTNGIDVTTTYPAAGNVAETFVVAAYSPVNGDIVDIESVTISFTVQPAEAPGTCTISRVANSGVKKVGDPLKIQVTSGSPVISATLNGQAYHLGDVASIAPSAPGKYTVNVEARTAQQTFTCSSTFETPVCTHHVTKVTPVFLSPTVFFTSETTVQGPAAFVLVNGAVVLPPFDKITQEVGVFLPFLTGSYLSWARVWNMQGDIAECAETVSP